MRTQILFKIASWNVNSLNVRLPQVLDWLQSSATDILLLQETKLSDDKFPAEAFRTLGYHVAFSGQKTYNGVAIISKYPIEALITNIEGLDDPQRRILIASIAGIRIINLYVPNGAALDSDKYPYKLAWLQAIQAHIQQELNQHPHLLVAGDFNIAPEDKDVHEPALWQGGVLVSPKEREAFQNLLKLGLYDSFRLFTSEAEHFSWWDYRQAAFRRNMGLRIDLILISEALKSYCTESAIDKAPRKNERPSDHTPVYMTLSHPPKE